MANGACLSLLLSLSLDLNCLIGSPNPWLRRRARQVPLLSRTAIDWGLMLTGIPLCLLARAANIFPLSAALNARRRIPLPRNLQVRFCEQTLTLSLLRRAAASSHTIKGVLS